MDPLREFVINECIPAEETFQKEISNANGRFSKQPEIMETLKVRAQHLGLFNLFFFPGYSKTYDSLDITPKTESQYRPKTLLEYADLCEVVGMSPKIAPESCNCNAPDTGNMELLAKYANRKQQLKYLKPLLEGKIRSAFAMTEPAVASSDAVNIETTIQKREDKLVVNGRKWWISNAGHPNLNFYLVFGVSDPHHPKPHRRHSIVLVPADAPGVKVVRPMTVFGYDDAPEGHCEVVFDNVEVDLNEGLVYKEGAGFEIIQGRLGPGRIHHCMRAIGMAERVVFELIKRVNSRKAFGKYLNEYSDIQQEIGKHRIKIDQSRLLVRNAASKIDRFGVKNSRLEIAEIKVAVPKMLCDLIDYAIQVFGAAGLGQDQIFAEFYAGARSLRIADGPDAVHLMQIAKQELKRAKL